MCNIPFILTLTSFQIQDKVTKLSFVLSCTDLHAIVMQPAIALDVDDEWPIYWHTLNNRDLLSIYFRPTFDQIVMNGNYASSYMYIIYP